MDWNEKYESYLYVDVCETLIKSSCGSKVQQRHLERHDHQGPLIIAMTLKSHCQCHIIIIIVIDISSTSSSSRSSTCSSSNSSTSCILACRQTHPVCLWIIEEVGPVRISLHVPELEELPEAQHQDVLADLTQEQTHRNSSPVHWQNKCERVPATTDPFIYQCTH